MKRKDTAGLLAQLSEVRCLMKRLGLGPADALDLLVEQLRQLEEEAWLHEEKEHAEQPAWLYGQP